MMSVKEFVDQDPGQTHETVVQINEVVAKHAVEIGCFLFGDSPVETARLKADDKKLGFNSSKGTYVLKLLTPASVPRVLSRILVLTKPDGRRRGDDPRKVVDISKALAEAWLSQPSFHFFPELHGISEAAMLDPEGREYSAPGYHPDIKVLMMTDGPLKAAPGVAGKSRAATGAKKLRKLLRGFKFKTPADESAAIAAIMTALNRKSMPAAPMFQVTAPAAGTGKSKLVDVVSIIALGRAAAVMAMGRDENEFTKRLTGALAQGYPIISFDNIVREYGREDLLLQALTQTRVLLRLLGGSGIMVAPTLTTFFATGNNLRPVSDLKRRSCLIRLDAGVERPEHREFDFDVLAEASGDRNALIRAALDISKAYLEAGAPPVDIKPAGSFEVWDRMVRRPLVWLGLPDPLESAETLRELDPELEAATMMVEAWYRVFQSSAIKAADLIGAAKQQVLDGGGDWVDRNTDLREALDTICQDHVNPRRLGNWLRKNRDFIVGGKRITQAGKDTHANTILWRVETVE